ncbi:MAG: hypothetical protein IJL76_01785 [Bacilli bacterium]|nr:hypothetical protein [Bacilli bacterium]
MIRKFLKKRSKLQTFLIGLTLGILVAGTSVYAIIYYQASQVSYDDTKFGTNMDTVQAALDDLYSKYQD